jgi:hypothetical protein
MTACDVPQKTLILSCCEPLLLFHYRNRREIPFLETILRNEVFGNSKQLKYTLPEDIDSGSNPITGRLGQTKKLGLDREGHSTFWKTLSLSFIPLANVYTGAAPGVFTCRGCLVPAIFCQAKVWLAIKVWQLQKIWLKNMKSNFGKN